MRSDRRPFDRVRPIVVGTAWPPQGLRDRDRVRHRAPRTGESNPVTASSLLINAYVGDLERSAAARSEGRLGLRGRDARATTPAAWPLRPVRPRRSRPTWSTRCSPTAPATTSTTPTRSCSTPECADARSVVVCDRAAEQILHPVDGGGAPACCPTGQEIVVHKNNSDGKGNSYGCHENYLMDRAVPFGRIVHHATPHFVTRQIFTGAGKVGSEAPGTSAADVPFQLTQRADFFEEEVGLETTLKRPIVNTRDEPHADAQKYRRLHVIVGDANLSEVATLLKVGTTAIVLAMVEDDFLPRDFAFAQPGAGDAPGVLRPDAPRPLELADGTTRHRARACSGSCSTGPGSTPRSTGSRRSASDVGPRSCSSAGRRVLTGLESDPMSAGRPASTGWPSTG